MAAEYATGDELMNRTLIGASSFDLAYGLDLLECDQDSARARVEVTEALTDRSGAVYGGVLSALAEGLASGGTNWSTKPTGRIGIGMSNTTSFLRPVRGSWIYGKAHRAHAEGDVWVWDVEIDDQWGRPCALSRITIAVRPAPPGLVDSSAR